MLKVNVSRTERLFFKPSCVPAISRTWYVLLSGVGIGSLGPSLVGFSIRFTPFFRPFCFARFVFRRTAVRRYV